MGRGLHPYHTWGKKKTRANIPLIFVNSDGRRTEQLWKKPFYNLKKLPPMSYPLRIHEMGELSFLRPPHDLTILSSHSAQRAPFILRRTWDASSVEIPVSCLRSSLCLYKSCWVQMPALTAEQLNAHASSRSNPKKQLERDRHSSSPFHRGTAWPLSSWVITSLDLCLLWLLRSCLKLRLFPGQQLSVCL